ncbi:hypothetical protein PB01_04600 [Psychrobacillus glaciei]|uniref:Uncharacterized protein n=1 Tax=Psychrobacillus glaciei TaxID=2283160 RepID=A0A5J6SJL7_9BACI|nr:hypothetical protein [Psychrobacillus glaciei]QFF98156.1 hypothetical protein PB01_04600 [Psychrobacillus glaciei]
MTSEEKNMGNINSPSSIADEQALKVIGYYKRQAWALKVFDKIDQDNVIADGTNVVLASSIIQSTNNLYFPAYMRISTIEEGKVVGAYLIIEEDDSFQLLPLERALEELQMNELLPFKYRTLGQIDGDTYQVNWPDFS